MKGVEKITTENNYLKLSSFSDRSLCSIRSHSSSLRSSILGGKGADRTDWNKIVIIFVIICTICARPSCIRNSYQKRARDTNSLWFYLHLSLYRFNHSTQSTDSLPKVYTTQLIFFKHSFSLSFFDYKIEHNLNVCLTTKKYFNISSHNTL